MCVVCECVYARDRAATHLGSCVLPPSSDATGGGVCTPSIESPEKTARNGPAREGQEGERETERRQREREGQRSTTERERGTKGRRLVVAASFGGAAGAAGLGRRQTGPRASGRGRGRPPGQSKRERRREEGGREREREEDESQRHSRSPMRSEEMEIYGNR